MRVQNAAVIGHPIGHTMSPFIHQRLFALEGIPVSYQVLDVPDLPAALPALPPYLHLLGARREALPLLKHTALPLSHSLARLEQEGPECACIAAAQAKASDFGALCRKVPGPMGGVYRQKIIFLTN